MRNTLPLLSAVVALLGCGGRQENSELPASDLKQDLQTLAGARVFFGHQSVGRDILQGLAGLAKEYGVELRIVDVTEAHGDTLPGIFHSNVGTNRNPDTKCRSFADHLVAAARYDAALLKFCYVDLGAGALGDPADLLAMYKKMLTGLAGTRPGLPLIHVTIPLKSDPLSLKQDVKRHLGLDTYHDDENVRRNRYNSLLAAEFGEASVFDLARAQSTLPDGRRTGFSHEGGFVFTMAKAYTYDEGHLNTEGQAWVAREFARVVAGAVRQSRARLAGPTSAP